MEKYHVSERIHRTPGKKRVLGSAVCYKLLFQLVRRIWLQSATFKLQKILNGNRISGNMVTYFFFENTHSILAIVKRENAESAFIIEQNAGVKAWSRSVKTNERRVQLSWERREREMLKIMLSLWIATHFSDRKIYQKIS